MYIHKLNTRLSQRNRYVFVVVVVVVVIVIVIVVIIVAPLRLCLLRTYIIYGIVSSLAKKFTVPCEPVSPVCAPVSLSDLV